VRAVCVCWKPSTMEGRSQDQGCLFLWADYNNTGNNTKIVIVLVPLRFVNISLNYFLSLLLCYVCGNSTHLWCSWSKEEVWTQLCLYKIPTNMFKTDYSRWYWKQIFQGLEIIIFSCYTQRYLSDYKAHDKVSGNKHWQ